MKTFICFLIAVAQAYAAVPTTTPPLMPAGPEIIVFVNGVVRKPGKEAMKSGSKVWDALIQAGGTKDAGALAKVMLIRNEDGKTSHRTLDLAHRALSTDNIPLENGDVIYVPERFWLSRLLR